MSHRPTANTEVNFRFARKLFLIVLVFSIFSNTLMLVGPLFMLQIYDRVLGSGSEATLIALFVMVAGLYLIMMVLDYARSGVLSRIGARFEECYQERTFLAVLHRSVLPKERAATARTLSDLETIPKILASPGASAVFDLPWSPIFFAALFVFHPLLGWLGLAGGALLLLVTLANQFITRSKFAQISAKSGEARQLSEQARMSSELVCAQGMRTALISRWSETRIDATAAQLRYADVANFFAAFTKTFRLFLQSAILALGAWLVLKGQLSAGAMIAGSILLGRALAPIEQILSQWRNLQDARTAWTGLKHLLQTTPPLEERMTLPDPEARLKLNGLAVKAPGMSQAVLSGVNLDLKPGTALGVIGRSAAGKSSLARTLAGLWRPASGEVLLGGIRLDQYNSEHLGRFIGYLPQQVTFFTGTVAENIARMDLEVDEDAVVLAAKAAHAHDLIVGLPNGYDTVIEGGDIELSGGQRQRVALARALYQDPCLLVLDEPNAALDQEGALALNRVIEEFKASGRIAIVTTHRPDALAALDRLLIIEGGTMLLEGDKHEVMRKIMSKVPKSDRVSHGPDRPEVAENA